jgi:hypothetical protein
MQGRSAIPRRAAVPSVAAVVSIVSGMALLCAGLAVGAREARAAEPDRSRLIELSSTTLDITRPAAVPEHLRAAAVTRPGTPGADGEVMLVKFPGPVTARQYAALEAAAARIFTYLPHDTYLVRMPAERRLSRRAAQHLGASWTAPTTLPTRSPATSPRWHPLPRMRWRCAPARRRASGR